MSGRLLGFLLNEEARLTREIFQSPPPDYGKFLQRLGEWQQLQATKVKLAEIERGIEDPDEI